MTRPLAVGTASVLAAALLATFGTNALGQTPSGTGTGQLSGNGQLGAGVEVPGGTPTNPANATTVGATSGNNSSGGSVPDSPFRWHREYDPTYAAPKNDGNPFTGGATGIPAPSCTREDGVTGRPYVDELIDTRDGTIASRSEGCEFPAQPGSRAAIVPQPPPPPPSPAEVWRVVPLPNPVVGINPAAKGLTGLGTWLWSTDPGPLAVQASIRGYTTTARAHSVRWVWAMWQSGDTPNLNPDPRVESSVPGTEASPAATYVYETKGDYTVTLTVWWAGDFTFTGNGVAPQTQTLGETSRSASRPYHVIEVRSVLVSGTG